MRPWDGKTEATEGEGKTETGEGDGKTETTEERVPRTMQSGKDSVPKAFDDKLVEKVLDKVWLINDSRDAVSVWFWTVLINDVFFVRAHNIQQNKISLSLKWKKTRFLCAERTVLEEY